MGDHEVREKLNNMSGQITVPEPTKEEKAYFNKLQAAGSNSMVGGAFGGIATIGLVTRMKNKAIGAALGAFVGITSFGVGRALDMQDNIKRDMESGAFERDFPEGAWKEMMRASAQGRQPDAAVMEHYSGPPAYQPVEEAQSPQYQSYADLNGQTPQVGQPPIEEPIAIIPPQQQQEQQYQSYANLASMPRQPPVAASMTPMSPPIPSEHQADMPPLPPVELSNQTNHQTKRYNKYGDEILE